MAFAPLDLVPKRPPLARTFHALRYRDYRLYWSALLVSYLGVAFQTVAQGWLVYRLTGSAFKLGLVGFTAAVISAPASIVGGIIADRVPRQKLVAITQTLMIFPPLGLAYLVWREQVQVWHVVVASIALGAIAQVDLPARTSLLPQLVEAGDFTNAQGLSSATYQASRMIGPALAGLVIAHYGEAFCFFINGVSYAAMALAFLFIRPRPVEATEKRKGARSGLLAGFRYILQTRALIGLVAMLTLQGLFLAPYITVLPMFANNILRVGPVGFGWLNAFAGAGALLGALLVANIEPGRRGLVIIAGGVLTPLALAAFAWSPWFALSLPMLLLAGMGIVLINTIAITLSLSIVPDDVRGRVASLGILFYFGSPQIGGVLLGFVADQWSAPLALGLSAGLFLLGLAVVSVVLPEMRRLE
jgi:MFS family permease